MIECRDVEHVELRSRRRWGMRLYSRIGKATHHNSSASDALAFKTPQSILVTEINQYGLSISEY